jgi:hypothetical protein
VAGGLVAWWAVDRFYRMARVSSSSQALVPYCVGAGLGVAYGELVLRRHPPAIARVPLGAAIYLANPERTAGPPKGGRDVSEKAGNMALRLASRGLKKVAEMAIMS